MTTKTIAKGILKGTPDTEVILDHEPDCFVEYWLTIGPSDALPFKIRFDAWRTFEAITEEDTRQ